MTPLERITARVSRNGDVNNAATPRPLLTLEEFFDGNSVAGSMCGNCLPMTEPPDALAVLTAIRQRPNVADIRVAITMFDDPEFWPYSDTVWVITSASAREVKSWFEESVAPDETWVGWTSGMSFEPLEIKAGMQPVACWWD